MGDVTEIRARLSALYSAGRIEFPDKAADVSSAAAKLESATANLNELTAQCGEATVLRQILGMAYDVHTGMGRMVSTLNDCAVGLIHIADDFAGTDADAQAAFNGLSESLRNGSPPEPADVPSMPDPSTPGAGEDYEPSPIPVNPDEEKYNRDEDLEDKAPDLPEMPT